MNTMHKSSAVKQARPRLERVERETILLFNAQDLYEGFFSFSTSELRDWKRFLKRVGGERYLFDVKIERDAQGNAIWFSARVPKELYSRHTFGTKKVESVLRKGKLKLAAETDLS